MCPTELHMEIKLGKPQKWIQHKKPTLRNTCLPAFTQKCHGSHVI